MWISRAVFEKLTGVYETTVAFTRAEIDKSLDRVLAAKEEQVKAVIAAKDDQILFLQTEVQGLRQGVERERARAEAAVDSLLAKNADMAPIRHADLQRKSAENEVNGTPSDSGAPVSPEAQRSQVTKRIFSELNTILEDGDDIPDEKRDEILTMNGAAIGAR